MRDQGPWWAGRLAARMRRTSVLPGKTLAQGAIHSPRAGKMAQGGPGEGSHRGAASKMLEFEYAAVLRDRLIELRKEMK